MGQKVHPFGFRVGITEAHKSRWYAPKALYGELLVEDQRIRKYIDNRLNRQPPFAAVSDIHIERTREELKVVLHTARPGVVIGPKGAEVDKLREELEQARSDPLAQPLCVFGIPRVVLYCATSSAHADFTAKLVRVRPTGAAEFICRKYKL